MSQFLFCKDEINDKHKFNKQILERRYKNLAKICHPDRPSGNNEIFMRLQINYGVLQGLLNSTAEPQKSEFKKDEQPRKMKMIEYNCQS